MGSGHCKDTLQKQYPGVEFTGYQSGSALKQFISEASFSVVPSECYENCPMAVLESMAYGKPVIGTNIGGIPEQIEDGKSGLLFEQGNPHNLRRKMALLIHDEAIRQKMGETARKIIEEKYSLDVHGNKLVSIYKELIER